MKKNNDSIHLKDLNTEQEQAVLYTNGPLVIIAGAGSGKTRTLTHKISYLIDDLNVSSKKILAVTFTNKASQEMKDRIISMIGKKGQDVQISTYHSFAAKILRIEAEKIGYKSNFNILDNVDQKQILSPIYKKNNISPKTYGYSQMISYISKNKIGGISPEEILENAKKDDDKILGKVYQEYNSRLKTLKSMDFDDLLLLVHKLFKTHPEIANKWSNKYEYVLVDEFQDTSLIQFEIIEMMSLHQNITIVGDPDQTIYTWRKADPTLLSEFNKRYKKAKMIKLVTNYRSTKNILDAANKLITFNTKRIDKKLVSTKDEGEIIEFYRGFSEEAESRWIVSKIQELRKNRNQLKDIAILYRANYLSASIERALLNEGINYVIFGGVKFYQRQEIKDAIAYLRIIANDDNLSFIRMINVPARKIGAKALEKLMSFAQDKNLPLYEAIRKHFNDVPLTTTVKKELVSFMNLITKFKKALETNEIHKTLSKFLIDLNYYSIWNNTLDSSRIENIKELINTIKYWESKHPNKNLNDYLDEVSLFTEKDDYSFGSDYVSLMTVHAAKGLEFENVFLMGFTEGVFPSKRAQLEGGQDALEEERRLAYVAITRAKNRLFVTDARGFSHENGFQRKPSSFLPEMGINVRAFSKEFIAPHKKEETYHKNRVLIQGDKVSHIKFGEGVVLSIEGELATIKFKVPHGEKTLMKNHKSLERL